MPYPDDFSAGRLDEAQGRDDAEAELARDREDLAIEHSAWRTLERARRELLLLVASNELLNEGLSAVIDELEICRNSFETPMRWRAERDGVEVFAESKITLMLLVLGKYYTAPSIGWARAREDGWTLHELPL
jgi:hypothetical protein